MMFRTFNWYVWLCRRKWKVGIGMVLVVPSLKADAVLQRLTEKGDGAVRIGSVVERRGTSPIIFMNLSTAFTCEYLQPPKPKIKASLPLCFVCLVCRYTTDFNRASSLKMIRDMFRHPCRMSTSPMGSDLR
ncbi:unnamed protein product [Haemonchus placei]|uniref:Secreted protein n=1 Tax=Haemonchus placei TaxID=6290 RepID=A0A0N4X891_HAEPC|nr:unnamed protein product [Haemonchus placei]